MSQNYKLTLVNVFWTENGIDTRYFKSVDEQRQYFDILTEGVEAPFVNFKMGDNIVTRVTYKDNSSRSIEELLRCNYCVVQKFNVDHTKEIERRYFFAYPRNQDSMGQIIVDLSLDDLQTNYFKYKDRIAPCQINKAHLDRWVEDNSTIVSFNGDIDSKLFEREQIVDVAKRLTRRTKLNFKVSDSEIIQSWYNSNILGWVYIYCDIRSYKVATEGSADISRLAQAPQNVDNTKSIPLIPLAVFAYPVFKSDVNQSKYILFKGHRIGSDIDVKVGYPGFRGFRLYNNGSSYIKAMKFSVLPPMEFNSTYATIEGNILKVDMTSLTMPYRQQVFGFLENNPSDIEGLINVLKYNTSYETQTYLINNNISFSKSTIINATKNPIYNPKLLNSDYFELKITNERGEGFVYDFQKLNMKEFSLIYSEVLTPDITRSYARIKQPTGIYIEETSQNLTGLVDSADMSLMVDNDQLSQMLANNKNFYLQNYLNIGEKALMGGIGGAIAGGGYGALVSAGVNAGMSLINMNLTIDNMRNAPKDLKNANGNAIFNTIYTEPGLYIEEYEILKNEKEIINDEMFKNGYVVNLIGKVSDYDNIRHTFNYLSANVETILAPISIEEKERLKQKLLNVRFWNTDTIDYENSKNYERWLNNE